MTIEIAHPIYNGANPGKKCAGLAEWRILQEGAIVQVRITQTYKRGEKQGKLIFPNLYCIAKSDIAKYPTQIVRNNTKLYIVPLDDMSPKKFDLKQPQYYEKPKIEPPKQEIKQGELF